MAGVRRTRKSSYRKGKRRAMRKPRMSKAVANSSLVSIKRRYYVGAWNPTVSMGWNSTNYSFRLSNLPNYGEFTALFEQYKINAVKLTFIPQWQGELDQNNAQIAAASATPFIETPRLYTLIDRDGDPQISTENLMLENGSVRIVNNALKGFSIYVRKPCVQFEVGTSLGFSGAAPKPSPWLDCDNHGVNHFGVGIGAHVSGTITAALSFRVVATYYMQFKIAK